MSEKFLALFLLAIAALPAAFAQPTVSLAIGSTSGLPGTTVSLPITITSSGGAQPTAVQWAFSLPAGVTLGTVDIGASASGAGKLLNCSGNGCVVFGLNSLVIPNGTVATASFLIASNAVGTLPVSLTGVVASDANSIPSSGGTGTITLPAPPPLPALSSLNCTAGSIATPGSVSCTVALTAAAQSGGFTVSLASNNGNLTVPASVSVPNGQTSTGFSATALQVASDAGAIITASAAGVQRTANITLLAPAALSSLTCTPGNLNSGQSATCTATLTKTSASGVTVALSDNNASLTTPANVGIGSGSASATFTVTAGPIASNQTATVTAALNGVQRTAQVNLIAPPPAALSGLSCTLTAFSSAGQSVCTVTLTAVAVSNAVVALSDSSTNVVVPGSVTVPAGQSSVPFTATITGVPVTETVVIAAALNGGTATTNLSLTAPVVPASLASLSCAPGSLNSNQSATCTVNLDKGSVGTTTVTLSDDSAQLVTPGNVAIGNGLSSASFNVTATVISLSQTATVAASLNGVNRSATVSLVAPAGLSGLSCSPKAFSTAGSAACTVTLVGASVGNTTIALSEGSANVTVPDSVTVLNGQNSAQFAATVTGVPADETVVIAAGLNGGTQTTSLSLTAPVVLTSLSCAPGSLTNGQSATCTVSLSKAAAGGVVIGLSGGSAALTVPANVTVANGAASGAFSITAGTVASNQTATVSASLNGVTKSALVNLTAPAVPAALTSIQCAPASLNSNQSATCTVNLDKSSNGVTTLTLSDDNAQLTTPGNLAIGNGASSASFTVAATAISLSQTATVTASLSGVTKSFPVILTAPVVPASLVSILCAPSSLNSNQSATCTVTLDKSLDGIASVALSDNSAQLATPGGVSIDKNASSASFNVTTGGISFSQTVTVAASLNGVNRSTTVSLIAPAGLSGLNCSPSTFTAAGSATCTVTLAGAAAGNTVIGLSEGSANVTVPGAVTVIGGQSSAQFTASVTGIPADEAVALTAALNGGTQTTTLTLSAPATLLSLTCAPGSLKSGENATCVATLNSPSKGGTSVSLSSDNALLKGPSLIAIPNGASSASFPVTAGTIVSSQTATLSAALNGITRTSQISLAAPAVITLSSLNCSPNSFNLAGTAACTVTLSAPVLSNTLVALSTSGTGVSVSGTVTVLAGTKEAQFSAAVSAVQADTTGTITAALNGTTRSANLTLKAPAAEVTVLSSLTCSPEALKNNQSSTCTVTLTKPSTGGVTLTLADDNAALNTPLNVAVAPGASTASFGVSVGKIASNQTASVTASWGGSAQTAHIHLEFTASAAPGSAALSSLVCNPTSIAAGGSTLCVVTLSSPADATAVGLASSSDQLALPATVNVPPAAASAQFRVNIPASAPPQQVVLTATLAAISQTARLAITAAGPAPGASQLTSLACSPSHLAPGETSVCTVYLKDLAGASISPTVAASSPNLVVPATVDFPVGSKSQSFNAVASPALSTAQSVDVTVTHDGHTVTTRLDLNLGSAEPTLTSLDCSTASLASGSGAVCVVTLKSAAPFASEISLSSSDALLQVPSRTSIGTGATNVSFAVQAGTTDVPRSVTLSASWNGRSPVTKVLQVKPHTITLNAPSSVFTREPVPVGFDVKATHSAGLATSITAPSLPKGAVLRGSRFTWTPSANEVGEYPVLFRATDDTGLAATATTRVVVRPAKPVIQGLYNPAGYSAIDSCSPHAIVTFLGSGFSLHDPTEATSTPWPTELAGVRIRINGIYAPITYVSDTTVHFQCPAFKPGESLQIVMEYESVSSLSPNVTGAVSTTSTAPVVARMDDAAPGIYQLNGSQAAALISGTGLVAGPPIGGITGEGYPSRFVVPGEYLEIYANGLGETSGSLLPGEPAPLDQLLRAAGPITAVFEDGKRVIADFAGLTPGSVGLFQINVLVPAGVVLGDAVPLYLELKRPDGSVLRSNTVTIAVGR